MDGAGFVGDMSGCPTRFPEEQGGVGKQEAAVTKALQATFVRYWKPDEAPDGWSPRHRMLAGGLVDLCSNPKFLRVEMHRPTTDGWDPETGGPGPERRCTLQPPRPSDSGLSRSHARGYCDAVAAFRTRPAVVGELAGIDAAGDDDLPLLWGGGPEGGAAGRADRRGPPLGGSNHCEGLR
jgi:hypothetical protein